MGMRYDPSKSKKMLIWKKYPDLARRRFLCEVPDQVNGERITLKESDLDKIVRFCIWFVDPEAPDWNEKDFDHRLARCRERMVVTGEEDWYQYIERDHDWWHHIMHAYFTLVHDRQYKTWFTYLMSYNNICLDMTSNRMKDSDTRKYMADMDLYNQQLAKLEVRIFNDERSRNIIEKVATENILAGYAEKYALDQNF